jgi:hypothetical protein
MMELIGTLTVETIMQSLKLTSAAASNLLAFAKRVRSGEVEGDKVAFAELEAELESSESNGRKSSHEWVPGARGGACIVVYGCIISYSPATDVKGEETHIFSDDTGRSHTLRGDHRDAFKSAAPLGWEAVFAVYNSLKAEYGRKSHK